MRTPLILAAAALAFCLSAAPAQADLVLLLKEGKGFSTNTNDWDAVVLDDKLAGASSSGGNWVATESDAEGATTGVVSYSGMVGNFTLNMTSGISKPVIGTARLDLFSLNVSSPVGGDLTIALLDTDYVVIHNPALLGYDIGGTTDGTVDFEFLWSQSNSETDFFPLATESFGPGAFSASGGEWVAMNERSPSFSLLQVIEISHDPILGPRVLRSPGSITSLDSIVPEPTSAALLLLGAAGLALQRRRRRRA